MRRWSRTNICRLPASKNINLLLEGKQALPQSIRFCALSPARPFSHPDGRRDDPVATLPKSGRHEPPSVSRSPVTNSAR